MSVSFPKPLTEKEEKYYIGLYEQGDEDAKKILIEKNLRLVAHIAKKYTSPSLYHGRFHFHRDHRTHQSCEYVQQQQIDTTCHLCCALYRE